MGNAGSLSLGGTAIAAAAAAATAAWAFSSFSKDTGSRQNLPDEVYEELQMLNVPVDYGTRCRDPVPVYHQAMVLEIDDGDDDDGQQQQQLPWDPFQGELVSQQLISEGVSQHFITQPDNLADEEKLSFP